MVPLTAARIGGGIDFGLIFFSSNEAPFSGDKYRLVIESTRYADQHGFSSVWIPERHFTKDGWLYPNPAVLQAALARETNRIHLRAGSVVVPLHNPLRVAEEWAMVDNLSGGRVGVSFASGWHPNDFSLAPENYADRNEVMYRNIEIVRKLWRGEAVPFKGGDGKIVELKTYPPPIQRDIPVWLTAAGNPKTFAGAGKLGANLLTHMYNQSVDELAEKIRIYRDARAENGYDPATGKVSVMLHTYVGADMDTVRAQIQGPFSEYLKSASYLVNAIAYSRGQQADLSTLSEQDLHDYLIFVTDRLISQQRVLFGTPETCAPLVTQLQAAGVDEIACQMDFGIDIDLVLNSMPHLNKLRELSNATVRNVDLVGTGSALGTTPTAPVREGPAHANPTGGEVPPTNMRTGASPVPTVQMHTIADIQHRCREEVSLPTFYQRLSDYGIQLTGSFQSIARLWRRDGEALGQIQFSNSLQEEANSYQIHPTLLDSCFQVIIATLPDTLSQQGDALYLPTGLRSFQLHAKPDKLVWSHARLSTAINPVGGGRGQVDARQGQALPLQAPALIEGDVRILDEQGNLLAEAKGLQLLRSEMGAGRAQDRSLQLETQTRQEEARVGARPTPTEITGINEWLYQLRWEAIDLPTQTVSTQPGHWLIFIDKQGIGGYLADQLEEQGQICSLIARGENFQILDQDRYLVNPAKPQEIKQAVGTALAAVRPSGQARRLPLRGVIHLWSLNTTSVDATNLATLEADQILGVQSALSLIQALIEETVQTQLWLITQGAQPVQEDQEGSSHRFPHSDPSMNPDPYRDLAVSQSPIWGLGKTCAIEHPELWGGLIDLDPHESLDGTTSQLMAVLQADLHEDQIALRNTKMYVARMVRVGRALGQSLQEQRPLHIVQDAAYLITGGLWGLGLEIARWLATQGARHLILLGRSKLPPRETWEQVQPESRQGIQIAGIRSIERLGAQVHYASIDVTDTAQLTAFLDHWDRRDSVLRLSDGNGNQQQKMPAIRGIIHAASVWQDAQGQSLVRPLVNLNVTDLMTVLRPKMLGGWLLANLFQETPLDFFVSFSSGASLFGSAAQGNYAAASEFLDVLAYYQRAHGQRAISIDWGAISEIGFGATPEGLRVHEYWESHGIQRISPKQVMAALELLIPQDLTRVGVLRLDWQLLQQFYPQITDLPLVSQLVEAGVAQGTGSALGTIPTASAHSDHEPSVHKGNNVLQTLREAPVGAGSAQDTIPTAPALTQRHAILTAYVQEQIANLLRISANRLDTEQPLTALGLDSLMAIELKNSIELDLQIRIPIVTLLQGPSITQFVNQVLTQLEGEKSLVPVGVGAVLVTGSAQGAGSALGTIPTTQVVSEIGAGVSKAGANLTVGTNPTPTNIEGATLKVGASPTPTDIGQHDAAQLLARLDQLSDQDVDSLLSQMLAKEEE